MKFKNLLVFFMLILIISCTKDKEFSMNIFSVDDDIKFGREFEQEIKNDPATYPILDSIKYPAAYEHLYRVRNKILASDNLNYSSRFVWKVYIIDNDEVVNAFATPGGYLYFYTGLIKFLDNEAQFAGVMAHEIAHSDRRHSTNQMTKAYGIDVLLNIVLGKNSGDLSKMVAEMASGLSSLAFSRSDEYEADAYAVKYLSDTDYDPKSLGDFFKKLHDESVVPVFLRTHPSSDDRLEKINEAWQENGAKEGSLFINEYTSFKNSLP